MIAGAAGMVAYAAVSVQLLKRLRASRAARVSLGAWFSVAGVVAVPVLTA